jgi:hypothetical protein
MRAASRRVSFRCAASNGSVRENLFNGWRSSVHGRVFRRFINSQCNVLNFVSRDRGLADSREMGTREVYAMRRMIRSRIVAVASALVWLVLASVATAETLLSAKT